VTKKIGLSDGQFLRKSGQLACWRLVFESRDIVCAGAGEAAGAALQYLVEKGELAILEIQTDLLDDRRAETLQFGSRRPPGSWCGLLGFKTCEQFFRHKPCGAQKDDEFAVESCDRGYHIGRGIAQERG
jgi:hypothetical protein